MLCGHLYFFESRKKDHRKGQQEETRMGEQDVGDGVHKVNPYWKVKLISGGER